VRKTFASKGFQKIIFASKLKTFLWKLIFYTRDISLRGWRQNKFIFPRKKGYGWGFTVPTGRHFRMINKSSQRFQESVEKLSLGQQKMLSLAFRKAFDLSECIYWQTILLCFFALKRATLDDQGLKININMKHC